MKYFFLLTLNICLGNCLLGQESSKIKLETKEKPPLDTSVFDNNSIMGRWIRTTPATVSHNGQYVFYTIINQPTGGNTLVFRRLDGECELRFVGAKNPVFTDDSKKAFFINQHDSLCLITLDEFSLEYVANVISFEIWNNAYRECIIYQLKKPGKRLILRELTSGSSRYFDSVDGYWLHHSGNIVLLKWKGLNDSANQQELCWLNMTNGDTACVWQGSSVKDLVLDDIGTQLVFTGENSVDGRNENNFWYYKTGMEQAKVLVIPKMDGIDSNLEVKDIQYFSKSGRRLFVTLKEKINSSISPDPDAVKSDVWSYLDIKLQSQQLHDLAIGGSGSSTYAGVFDISSQRIMCLKRENEEIQMLEKDDWAIITKTNGGILDEWYWNKASIPSFYLVSTLTGDRKRLPLNYPTLSPGGRYLVGTDSYIPSKVNNVLSYDIETSQVHNLTRSLGIPLDDKEVFGSSSIKHRGLMVSGAWLPNDKALLIYDQYDIWQLDPSGKKMPINLTNGYGRRRKLVFHLAPFDRAENPIIAENKSLILSAFDKTTKNNGLYWIIPKSRETPRELLTMAAAGIGDPIRARDTGIYIISRETATQSPNSFWTSDFKKLHPITNIYPEKAYNWLTSELIRWKTFDGAISSGILYKPENFKPNRKYPVIINYYEEYSDLLNSYIFPGTSNDNINIAWFVSNGYLVFVPDIHFRIGYTGKSAYNSVVSAAKHLAQFPWVDAKHMGIQGHSFGGYETNYIVTHTNLFAAAMSSSGCSNLISAYGSVFSSGDGIGIGSGMQYLGEGNSQQYFCETHQYRLGCNLWAKPDIYIENSPIFQAHKVTTPLLMMNNKKDAGVHFEQGVEFFTALRRLGKRVWMLQYDDGNHTLYPGSKDALLHTIRMTQFFDHYLKGAPAPQWMTRGIPANKKGVDYGLEPDLKIVTPGQGLLEH